MSFTTNKTVLKSWYETGDIPTQAQFHTLIDSIEAGNTSLIVGLNGVLPNIDTANDTLDLGSDPLLVVATDLYRLQTIHAGDPDKYRNISLTAAGYSGTARRLYFNRETAEFICYAWSDNITDSGLALIGVIREPSAGNYIASFDFDFTLNGVANTAQEIGDDNVRLISDIGGFMPNVDTAADEIDFGADAILIIGTEHYRFSDLHPSNPERYRNVNIRVGGATSSILYFNTDTNLFELFGWNAAPDNADLALVATFRHIGSSNILVSSNFDYTINGEGRYLTDASPDNLRLVNGIDGVLPNITLNGFELDLGNDPLLLVGNNLHRLATIHSGDTTKYKNIVLDASGTSASKLFFNKATLEFETYAWTSNVTANSDLVLVGGIRKVGSELVCDFPFEFTVNGENPNKSSARSLGVRKSFEMISHRGMWVYGLAPENSIDAINLSGRFGFNLMEIDIQPTLDGKFVMMHDDTINRTMKNSDYTDIVAPTNVFANTLAALEANYVLASGNERMRKKIPTYEETLAACRDNNIKPVIEIKGGNFTNAHLDDLYDIANEMLGKDNFIFHSFNVSYLDYIRTISATVELWYITDIGLAAFQAQAPAAWLPNYTNLTEANVKAYRKEGIDVYCYTVPNAEQDNVASLGVSGMMSDYGAMHLNDKSSLKVITTDGGYDAIDTNGTVTADSLNLAVGNTAALIIGDFDLDLGGYVLQVELNGRAQLVGSGVNEELNSNGVVKTFTFQCVVTNAPTVVLTALDATEITDIKFNLVQI